MPLTDFVDESQQDHFIMDSPTPTITLPPKPPQIPVQKPKFNPTISPSELRQAINNDLNKNENFPSELPVKQTIGKSNLMQPSDYALHHKATPLLQTYAEFSVPVDCGPSWSMEQITQLLQQNRKIDR